MKHVACNLTGQPLDSLLLEFERRRSSDSSNFPAFQTLLSFPARGRYEQSLRHIRSGFFPSDSVSTSQQFTWTLPSLHATARCYALIASDTQDMPCSAGDTASSVWHLLVRSFRRIRPVKTIKASRP